MVVFENYKIIHSKKFGAKSSNSPEKTDKNTTFYTGSIDKPIIALLCIILEEKGLLDLNEPIEKSLKRWHLPKSKFPENKEIISKSYCRNNSRRF